MGQGNFSKPVRVPPDLVVGAHQLVAAGVGPNGLPDRLKMAITVQAAGSALAVTGAPIAAMLQLGLATVFGGGGLLFAAPHQAPAGVVGKWSKRPGPERGPAAFHNYATAATAGAGADAGDWRALNSSRDRAAAVMDRPPAMYQAMS